MKVAVVWCAVSLRKFQELRGNAGDGDLYRVLACLEASMGPEGTALTEMLYLQLEWQQELKMKFNKN